MLDHLQTPRLGGSREHARARCDPSRRGDATEQRLTGTNAALPEGNLADQRARDRLGTGHRLRDVVTDHGRGED